MRSILLLVHRIPYPPNKGDKIRSYHLLRYLSRRYRVFLGAFVDDPFDLQYEAKVRELCAGVHLVTMSPRARRLASLRGLVTGEALSQPYYRDGGLQQWVDETLVHEGIDTVVVFSSTMSQFVDGARHAGLRRVADFVDVDSDKWRQYARRAGSGPRAWVYGREATRMLAFERRVAAQFDATLFVTKAEADLFRSLAPECAGKVGHYENGVDTDYFDPSLPYENPYPPGGPVMVFTGAMDYWPNAEAVTWFSDEVMPLVLAQSPQARFAIVGSNPTEDVKALGRRPGIIVTGRVPDVRPYLRHADVAVAPLRIARGIQNKVLEALAMARPVVCTGPAAEGLHDSPLIAQSTADDAEGVARMALERIGAADCPMHRALVLEHYSWESHLEAVGALIDGAGHADEATGSDDATGAVGGVGTGDVASERPGPRIIVYSSLFPSAAAPTAGTFIRERMFRVAQRLPLAVVAPQPWSPFDPLVRLLRKSFRPQAVAFEVMDGVEVHRPRVLSIPGVFKRWDGWLMALGSQTCVRRLRDRMGANLIDAHFLYPDGWAATQLGKRLGLPVTITLRGSKDAGLVGTDRERCLVHAMQDAVRLFAVSDSIKRDVAQRLGVPDQKVMVVGNGVDLALFEPVNRSLARVRLGLSNDAKVIIGVGNLVEGKGFQRIIPLLPTLKDRFGDVVLLIVGGGSTHGDMRVELEALAMRLGVTNSVRFCGRQLPSDLKWFYGAADVFALATAYEGWANVFLEAMACGLPVVSTKVGGNAQVVRDATVGALVGYWDAGAFVQALQDALVKNWDRDAIVAYANENGWAPRIDMLVNEFNGLVRHT